MAIFCGIDCNANFTPSSDERAVVKMLYPSFLSHITATFAGNAPGNRVKFDIQPITYGNARPAKVIVNRYAPNMNFLLESTEVFCGPDLTLTDKAVYIPKPPSSNYDFEIVYSNYVGDVTRKTPRFLVSIQ